MNSTRKAWIDGLKGLAILAVLLDHTRGTLYMKDSIWFLSFFAVPVFVMVAGYNGYSSLERHSDESLFGYLRRTLKTLLISYSVCVLVYSITWEKQFVLLDYLRALVTFKTSNHLYYVFMHAQLVFAGYFVFRILRLSNKWYKEMLLLVICIVFSIIAVKYTNTMDLFGGGGKLFGGTYIVFFVLGGLFSKHGIIDEFIEQPNNRKYFGLIGIILFVLWWTLMTQYAGEIDSWAKDVGVGCEGIELSGNIMGVLAFVGFGCAFALTEGYEHLGIILKPLIVLGKNSLSVFLYHVLIIYYLNKCAFSNIWVKRIVYCTAIILGSMMINNLLFTALEKVKNTRSWFENEG